MPNDVLSDEDVGLGLSDSDVGLSEQAPGKSWISTVFTSPKRPNGQPWAPPSPDESILGISPDIVPRGTTPVTSALSAIGKTALGFGQFVTSPKGWTEMAAAATPAAPVIMAKWAYDMARGGYRSTKAIVDELGQMANEALNRGIISANQLGPIPQGVSTQEHIQSLAENAANAAAMGLGVAGIASHALSRGKVTPTGPEPVLEAPKPAPEVVSPEQAPPSSALPGAPPAAPATVEARGEPVTAGPPEPATVEPTPIRTTTQGAQEVRALGLQSQKEAGWNTDWPFVPADFMNKSFREAIESDPGITATEKDKMFSAAEKLLGGKIERPAQLTGMGGALAKGEIPETGAGGSKYGGAARVVAERVQAGQIDPIDPGTGTSAEAQVKKYQEIVRRDPEIGPRIMEQFEADPNKSISDYGMGVVRAHGERLAAGAARIEEARGTESPEYQAAKKYLTAWDQRYQAMKTKWGEAGRGIQGETDIDTGSFTGLERARRQLTGKDIPEPLKPKAEKIAKENKDAQQEVVKADARMKANIRQKKAPADADKAAIDAANKTVREAAARMAEAENKQRVAQAQRDKDAANVQVTAARKALESAQKAAREAASKAAKEERRRQADPSIPVWEKANSYLEETKGLYSFDDLRNKIATDLGISTDRVTRIMSKDQTIKRLADDLWTKQRNARRLKEQAKIWLRELDTPGYQKALRSIPNFMFSASVFGHGLVALGTHAPIVAFQPRFWNAYVRNFGKMYKMVFRPEYYEQQMQDLVRRPNYELARRSGLQNDPFKYEEFHTTMLRDLVKDWIGEKNMNRVDVVASAGNRGYGVLKLLRQDMFDQRYDNLPKSIQVQEGVAEGISDGVNHATGVTQKQGFKGSNIIFFAPRLAASRVAWLGTDPGRAIINALNWKNATIAEKQFAVEQLKEKAWVFGTFASLLAMNQGFLKAAGSDQKINGIPEALGGAGFDPLASDFLKFKVHGANVAYGGALLTLCKLPVRVGFAIAYEGKGSKYVLEEERVDKVVMGYLRTQASPFSGTVADLALGRDFEQRPLQTKLFGAMEQTGAVPKRLAQQGVDEPYTWPEYAATKLPIPMAEAVKEGLKGSGVPDEQASYWTKAFGIGIIMTGTGTRITEDTREE